MPTRKKRGGAYSVKYAGREAAGNLRRRGNTLQKPNIRMNEADPKKLYTVVIWDPDAPHSPSFLHWLVVNISGGDIARGTTVQPYHPPSPPAGSGEHRYYVGLYEQGAGSLGIKKVSQTGFDIDTFVSRYGLIEKGLKMIKVKPGY
jgi:phosphatidylethanolamine-binding protein (PEBP) family uncharacterized protein